MIKPTRHPERLMPSDPDTVSLCAAVINNYNELLHGYRRIKGEDLLIPIDMEGARQRVVRMSDRYQRGDFRHNDSETIALRALAQWTVEINHGMREQEGLAPVIAWRD